jgi:hypothetical protein
MALSGVGRGYECPARAETVRNEMTDETHALGPWAPWRPEEVVQLFSLLQAPWWISGGWAIDLFLGEQTRAHEDIDVQFLRRDQQAVRALFPGWDVQEAHPELSADWPFKTWESDATLPPEVHDIWLRPSASAPWTIQLMVGESEGEQWICRRDARIRRPLATIGQRTADGVSYLAPEIQLFYKAKSLRPKDESDFTCALPALDQGRRRWLAQSLNLIHPSHPWLTRLI